MDTPLYDFTGLSEQTIDLLWFRADQLAGNRELAFATVLAAYRAEQRLAKVEAALEDLTKQIDLGKLNVRITFALLVAHAQALKALAHD